MVFALRSEYLAAALLVVLRGRVQTCWMAGDDDSGLGGRDLMRGFVTRHIRDAALAADAARWRHDADDAGTEG